MKFGFIAKHRGIWPAGWLCGALGVSRGGFYAWLTRPRSQRSHSDEELGAKVRTSFLGSDRTYGARRVWHDVLAEGARCGLHRIERLMRLQGLKARPRRRRLPPDVGEFGLRSQCKPNGRGFRRRNCSWIPTACSSKRDTARQVQSELTFISNSRSARPSALRLVARPVGIWPIAEGGCLLVKSQSSRSLEALTTSVQASCKATCLT